MLEKPSDPYFLLGEEGEWWPKENEDAYAESEQLFTGKDVVHSGEVSDHVRLVNTYRSEKAGDVFDAHTQYYGYKKSSMEFIQELCNLARSHAQDMHEEIAWEKSCQNDTCVDYTLKIKQHETQAATKRNQAETACEPLKSSLITQAKEHETQAEELKTQGKEALEYSFTEYQERLTIMEQQTLTQKCEIQTCIDRTYLRLNGEPIPGE